jgi:hypothetical protein
VKIGSNAKMGSVRIGDNPPGLRALLVMIFLDSPPQISPSETNL